MRVRQLVNRTLDVVDPKNRVKAIRNYYLRDRWLHGLTNVIHVGANTGNEASRYAAYDVGVLWIEPIPHVFDVLQRNIAPYPKQRAIHALITDKAGERVALNISNNEGQSSSIFEFSNHKEIWPDVRFSGKIDLVSTTVDDILSAEPLSYDGLVIDTQGAELLVLKGATRFLPRFRAIKTEAANRELYRGAATAQNLISFLAPYGFAVSRKETFARGRAGLECFDLLFVKRFTQ
jgi:FkbM family methyltransferase